MFRIGVRVKALVSSGWIYGTITGKMSNNVWIVAFDNMCIVQVSESLLRLA